MLVRQGDLWEFFAGKKDAFRINFDLKIMSWSSICLITTKNIGSSRREGRRMKS